MSYRNKNTEDKLIKIHSDVNVKLFGDLLDSQDWKNIFTLGSIDDWYYQGLLYIVSTSNLCKTSFGAQSTVRLATFLTRG